MNNSFTPPKAIQTVDFHGQTLLTIEQDGIHYVAMRPICGNLGLSWSSQRGRIQRDEVLNSVVFMMNTTGKDGKEYKMLCLPIEYLNGWLFGINASRVKPELRETIILYKKECYLVLHAYWHNKTQPTQFFHLTTATKEERAPLVKAVRALVMRVPNLEFADAFSMVNRRFCVDHIDELTTDLIEPAIEYVNELLMIAIACSASPALCLNVYDYEELEKLLAGYQMLEELIAEAVNLDRRSAAAILGVVNRKLDKTVSQFRSNGLL